MLVHNKYKPSDNPKDYELDPENFLGDVAADGQFHKQIKKDILTKARQLEDKAVKTFFKMFHNPDIKLDKKGFIALMEAGNKKEKKGVALGEIFGTIYDFIKNWSEK